MPGYGLSWPACGQFTAVAGDRVSPRLAAQATGAAVTGGAQPLALVLALAGSGCYAVAVVTQQDAAKRAGRERAFDLALLTRLVRRPAWLAGLAAAIAGFALQAAALGLGRLVLIEPVFATGLLFALMLAAVRDRRPLRAGERVATLAAVAGLAVFLATGQPAGGQRIAGAAALGLAAAGVAGLAGLCAVLAGRLPVSGRALALGVAGGTAAGANDAVTKTVSVLAAGHRLGIFADPRLYLLIVAGLLTYTIQQNGYRAGVLTAFLPAFAVVEAVSGSLLGLVIYHERLNDQPGRIAVEVVACAAAAWGIARLARTAVASDTQPPPGPVGTCGPAAASSAEDA